MLGQPAGSSFSPTAGNPASGTFSWTPTAPGDYLITLTASDQLGLGAVPRGIILRIGTVPPPPTGITVTGKGQFNSGTGRVYFELSNDTVSLDRLRGGAFTFTGDVDTITGAGSSATLTGTARTTACPATRSPSRLATTERPVPTGTRSTSSSAMPRVRSC